MRCYIYKLGPNLRGVSNCDHLSTKTAGKKNDLADAVMCTVLLDVTKNVWAEEWGVGLTRDGENTSMHSGNRFLIDFYKQK